MPEKSWRVVLARLGIAIVVLGGLYTGAAWYLSRHVPADTTVAGIPIGGKSPAEAEATLQRELAASASATLSLEANGRSAPVDPSVAGLALDLPATLAQLTGFSWHPARLWDHLTGGHEAMLKNQVDRTLLTATVVDAAGGLDIMPAEGSVGFAGGKVVLRTPVTGNAVDVDATVQKIADGWPLTSVMTAPTTRTEPAVSAAEIDRASREFAGPAVRGPVIVVIGKNTMSIPVAEFVGALSLRPTEGRLEPDLDDNLLIAAVRSAAVAKKIEVEPKDATVRLVDGVPEVIPATTGISIDDTSIPGAFLRALTSADRRATVRSAVVQPEHTTAEVEKTRPKGEISTFTTTFPDNPARTNNIELAARTLDGTYVHPGEQFSLNAALGERTPEKGYQQAGVIEDGRLTNDYGGGISQLSTTLFNAVFFSGAKIDQYMAHSFYISRYPEGREATVSWPDVDQKFTNDTGGGILIHAFTSGSDLTITFYGTKVYDIEARKGPRRNIVAPTTIRDVSPGCVPQSPSDGFDVTVTRVFLTAGKVVRTSDFNTRYIPSDNVVCGESR